MRKKTMIALGSILILAMACLISCDSSSGGGGGTTTTSGGYKISDFAGTWKVYYSGWGYAGHTITLNSDGSSTRVALEECGGTGGVSSAHFTFTSDGRLVCKDGYLRCTGQAFYNTFKFNLEIRSANMLKGERSDAGHLADGTVIGTASYSIYLTR